MPSWTLFALILVALWPQPAAAQSEHPRENTVAIGGGVGFLTSDNGAPDVAQTLQATTGTSMRSSSTTTRRERVCA
jgi:hypothetical protein